MDVEHGDAYGEPGDLGFVGGMDLAIDQGDVRRSPAHIEGDDAVVTAQPRHRGSANHSARGTR